MKHKMLLLGWLLMMIFPFSGHAQYPVLQDSESSIQKFNQFFFYLENGYVEKVESGKLIETAIRSVLAELDPHSVFLSAEEMRNVNESFQGNFEGIGIEFNILNDTLIVVNTIVGGPSEKVGLKPNDRIITVNNQSVVGIKQTEVPKILRGPKGSKINVGVIRRGEPAVLDFTIERDKIPMNSVDAVYKPNPNTGYIKVNRFSATTSQEVRDALNKLGRIQNLIFDLRGNGGGFMDQSIEVAENFLAKGELIVFSEGRNFPRAEALSKGNGLFQQGRLIILVDEESASASEIVSGAVQDWDRGLIVGRPTFGKGLVQSQIPLLDGSAIRLTVARYHTPTGRMIQRPYELGKKEEYYTEFLNRLRSGQLTGVDASSIPDSLKYHTLKSGRIVLGGGGITPDIFVPLDTLGFSTYWSALVRRGIITDFVVDYMDKNRKSLEETYPDFETFQAKFTVDNTMIDNLVALGESHEVPKDPEGLKRSERMIKVQLKALIAQKLWDYTEYYRVLNKEIDNDFLRALEILDQWDMYGKGIYTYL